MRRSRLFLLEKAVLIAVMAVAIMVQGEIIF